MDRPFLGLGLAGVLFTVPMNVHGQADTGETPDTPPVINPEVSFTSDDTLWLTEDEIPVISAGTEVSRTVTILLKQPLDYVVQPPPVSVVVGSKIRLELGAVFAGATDIQWMQAGEPVGAGESAFEIELIPVDFHSNFSARFQLNGEEQTSHSVTIAAGSFAHQPLVNVSTRSVISPSNPQVIVGFSVSPASASSWPSKVLLVRAVGQTLADYGVTHPLPDPMVRIFNSSGHEVTPRRNFPAIVYDDGTTPESRHYQQVATVAHRVGAFPIPVPGPESPPISEYADLVGLIPGVYTIVVESAGGLSGDVLVEVYDVD